MKNIFLVDSDKKNKYLESINKRNELKTYELYTKLIYKLDEFEDYKGVQAVNMTKRDFMEFLASLNSSSLSVLYTYKSAINGYLISATDKQNFTIGLIELDKVSQDDLIECINEITESLQFVTKKEYYDIISSGIGNYQDVLVVVLLWNKIKGEKNFSDLLNLKISDVDLVNKTIRSKNNLIQLSELEINIVKEAIAEQTYTRTVMDKKGVIKKSDIEYVIGDYLVKATVGSTNKEVDTNQCTYGTFANRMSKYYNIVLQRNGLTNQRIYKSSVYYHILKESKRKLTLNEFTDYLNKTGEKISLSNMYREQDIMFSKMVEQGEI